MIINIPGVDGEKGLNFYDGDEELYLFVMRSYAEKTSSTLDIMRNVSAETLPDYIGAVHAMKGVFINIFAEEMKEKALKLEQMAKAGDLQGILAENDTFLKQADNLLADIRDRLGKPA